MLTELPMLHSLRPAFSALAQEKAKEAEVQILNLGFPLLAAQQLHCWTTFS